MKTTTRRILSTTTVCLTALLLQACGGEAGTGDFTNNANRSYNLQQALREYHSTARNWELTGNDSNGPATGRFKLLPQTAIGSMGRYQVELAIRQNGRLAVSHLEMIYHSPTQLLSGQRDLNNDQCQVFTPTGTYPVAAKPGERGSNLNGVARFGCNPNAAIRAQVPTEWELTQEQDRVLFCLSRIEPIIAPVVIGSVGGDQDQVVLPASTAAPTATTAGRSRVIHQCHQLNPDSSLGNYMRYQVVDDQASLTLQSE